MSTEQVEQTIEELEKSLPTPHFFKQLIAIYRRLGKQAKKGGDHRQALEYFNRILSLSKIWHQVYGFKKTGIEGREIDKAEKFLKQLVKTRGTLYPFTVQEHGSIRDDVLLSATDYKNLHQLSELVARGQSVGSTVSQAVPATRDSETRTVIATKPESHKERVVYGERSPTKTKGKALYISFSGQDVTIEQLALEHYQADGYEGLWSENEYWWQIMTLLYWDAVYAKLPDVYEPAMGSFPGRMQDIPRDMFTEQFFRRRQKMIEARHKSLGKSGFFGLKSPSPEHELRTAWRKHKGEPCRFFDQWQKFTIDELVFAARSLERSELIAIMNRLLRDFNSNRRGLPDLFLARDGRPLFVEVKGKGEKVSQAQLEWQKYLAEKVRVLVEVCRVVEKP